MINAKSAQNNNRILLFQVMGQFVIPLKKVIFFSLKFLFLSFSIYTLHDQHLADLHESFIQIKTWGEALFVYFRVS